MGLLDLPASLWSWTDMQMAAFLPATVRIIVWGIAAAAVSLGLYWLLSPQSRMAQMAAEERRIKRILKDDSLEMAEGLAAAKDLLRLAVTRIGLVVLPVAVAALPIVSLIIWLDSHYAYDLPRPEKPAAVSVEPSVANGRLIVADAAPRVDVFGSDGSLLESVEIPVPVPGIAKRAWWNVLIGNPLGYLPDDSPIDRIDIDLPANEYLPVGPDWLRGWATPFFVAMLLGSLLLKFAFRIH